MVAAYCGAQLNEYNPGSREEWFGTKKAQVGGDFPNLPYLKDGDFVLTESSAIPVYIALKHNKADLLGNNEAEKGQVRMLEGVIGDIRTNVFKILFAPGEKKEEFKKLFEAGGVVHTKAGYLTKYLGSKPFLVGHVTLADFYLVYITQVVGSLASSLGLACPLCSHENIKALCGKLTSLPGVKEHTEKRAAVPYVPSQMVGFEFKTLKDMTAAAPSK